MPERKGLVALLLALAIITAACGTAATTTTASVETTAPPATTAPAETTAPTETTAAPEPVVFGLIMVGPKEDHGWNQAHWEAAQYVIANNPDASLVSFDKLNPADNPGATVEQVVDDLVAEGATVIFTNSAEMKDGTNNAAKAHPDVTFIHISGDAVLTGEAPSNVGNIMGRMEYGKMIAGCAAALSSQSGKISYLGPLIDAETRRLVNSTYLGAKYCWENVRGEPAGSLAFDVTWIGFWFNIPGFTLDPTEVANGFFAAGSDVVLSGIDTTEGLVVTGQQAAAGNAVYAIPYDFVGACAEAADVCLGVPYFNWGPAYLKTINDVVAGTWQQSWDWNGPDWADINNPDTSAVGWVDGAALSAEAKASLTEFIGMLADGSLNLYTGPLNYQDGSEFIAAGASATDEQIWYTEQLLEGVVGASA